MGDSKVDSKVAYKPANLLKMNFFTYISQGFQLDIKLLFIVLFLGIISWKGVSRFNRGGGLFFSWGASFLNGGVTP